MRVLFTGGGGAGSQALWDLLGARYEIHFADADARRIHPAVSAGRAHGIPMASDAGFVSSVARLCHAEGIDVLVPGVDEELLHLARAHDLLEPTTLLLPHASFVETMLDKYSFAEALEAVGLPVPRTRLLSESEEWKSFPCIVKPRVGRGSRGVVTVTGVRELHGLMSALGPDADRHVLQELMHGQEYTVQVLANRSANLRAVLPARVLAKRGVTISAITEANPSVIAGCEAIHSRIPTPGCYNVQGIVDDRGVFMPFEVNPRVSTTLCLAVAAGADPFNLFLDDAATPAPALFEEGVGLERFWENRFVRATDQERVPSRTLTS